VPIFDPSLFFKIRKTVGAKCLTTQCRSDPGLSLVLSWEAYIFFVRNLIHYDANHLFSLLFANFELILSIIKTQHVFHIVNALSTEGAQLSTWHHRVSRPGKAMSYL